MVLRHLGCSAGTKKNKVGFIPNTTCQNKFWTELKNWQFIKKKYKIIWVKNYKSTRKIIREFLKSLRRGENLYKKNSKPISIRGKDGTIHLHTHTHTHTFFMAKIIKSKDGRPEEIVVTHIRDKHVRLLNI